MAVLLSFLTPLVGCFVVSRALVLPPLPLSWRLGLAILGVVVFAAWTAWAHRAAKWDLVAARGRLAQNHGLPLTACPFPEGWSASAWGVGWCLGAAKVRRRVSGPGLLGLAMVAVSGWVILAQGLFGGSQAWDFLMVAGLLSVSTR